MVKARALSPSFLRTHEFRYLDPFFLLRILEFKPSARSPQVSLLSPIGSLTPASPIPRSLPIHFPVFQGPESPFTVLGPGLLLGSEESGFQLVSPVRTQFRPPPHLLHRPPGITHRPFSSTDIWESSSLSPPLPSTWWCPRTLVSSLILFLNPGVHHSSLT